MSIEDREANYVPLQRKEVTFDEYVYMVTTGPLPTHIRSVSVKDNHTTNLVPALTKSRISSTRFVYVTLALVFILVTSVAVGVAIVKIAEIKDKSNILLLRTNSSVPTSVGNVTQTAQQWPHMVEGVATSRTRCVHRCHAYSAPKFESRCQQGVCECKGDNYQEFTCLPNVAGCLVEKDIDTSAHAFMDAERKSIYSCRAEPYAGSDVHVISVYGNHYSRATTVNISGTIRKPVTLVLANHYPVRWSVKYDGIFINNIMLLSKNGIASSSVTVETKHSENSLDSPEFQKLMIPVGFGDDRYSSDTVGMLRAITDIFGSFRSFRGADYADYWTIKIPDQ